jgi:hypothetical protein
MSHAGEESGSAVGCGAHKEIEISFAFTLCPSADGSRRPTSCRVPQPASRNPNLHAVVPPPARSMKRIQ